MNPPGEAGRRPVVFCVDDEPDDLSWLKGVLGDAGYEVRSETDSSRTVDRIREEHPDVVLLDVTLPGLDGYEICRRLQEYPETSFVPVLFIFPRGREEERTKALRSGAVACLTKPVEPRTLLDHVAAQLENRRRWAEMRRIRATAQAGSSPTAAKPAGPARWSSRFDPVQFSRFKIHLAERLRLGPDQRRLIAGLVPSSLYSGAARLGLEGRQVAETMADFLKLPYLPVLAAEQVKLGVFPIKFALTNHVAALASGDGTTYAAANPFRWDIVEILGRACGAPEGPMIAIAAPASFEGIHSGSKVTVGRPATLSEIQAQLRREYSALAPVADLTDREAATAGPLIDFVNRLIEEAYVAGASDVHVEPAEHDVVIRYRIDGDLRIMNRLQPPELIRRIIARIKVMSSLDLAEHRLPQDGRIRFKQYCGGKHDFDLRVAILPVNYGEKACLRIIDKQKSVMPLDRLGFSERNLRVYREKIRAPHGMILHVGPTGSGKSMSLYAALNEVVTPTMNIQTAEDPIEYTLAGINQTQMNGEIGLSFARALRSFLRADPDIILVGEIRDLETARTAIEASLTGHLLFSTLHTNDAASTIQRFIEMGIEPYLISSTLLMVCAQRLLRRLCPRCREAYLPPSAERAMAYLPRDGSARIFRARGCEACDGTGYKGRIAVHEILVPNDNFRRAINRPGISSTELKQLAVTTCGMTTLFQDAMEKVRHGVCSIEDALMNVAMEEVEDGAAEPAVPASHPPLQISRPPGPAA